MWNLALGSQAKAHAPKRFQPSRRPPRQQLLQLQILLQDCRLLGLKPPKRFQPARRPPRQHLLQLLHAPAICLSGGSRLPFARPQIQGNNSYSYSYYFKTAVCSASNPPNASNPPAGLQGNNSYSYYMPLPSVFQGVQDCRLPALKPPKPSRRPPRHLPSVFQGVQDCRLPALKPPKPPKPSRRPPRQQLLQLRALKPPKRFQPSRRPPRQQLLQLLHAPAICFSGGSRLPFARPQTPLLLQDCRLLGLKPPKRFQPARRPPRQQLLQLLHAPAICLSGGSRLPFARPQIQGNNSYSYSYYFKTAVCSASNPPNASNPPARLQGNNSYSYYMPLPSVFQGGFKTAVCPPSNPPNPPAGLQGTCHLFFRGFKTAVCPPSNPPNPQTLPQASKATTLTATCPQTPQTLPTLPQASKATTLTATTCPCHLSFRGFKTAVCPPSNPPNPPAGLQGNHSYSYMPSNPPNASNPPAGLQGNNSYSYYMPLPSVFQGVQDCRLPALKPPKPSRRPPRHLPSVFQGVQDCRLPALKPPKPPKPLPQASKATTLTATCPQTPQTLPTLPQASKATTLTATTCPCHLFFRGFKTAVCPPSNPPTTSRLPFARPQTPQTLPTRPQASKATTLTATTCPCHLSFRGFKTAVCPPSNPRQQLLQLQLLLQDCRLLGLKPPKRFQPARTPPRQQLLQLLHAPAICLSGGVQDCRLPALKPPKPSRRPPRHLPSVFQGVQDCRLPALKPPKPPKPSRRPPRQQLLQLHALKPPKRFQPSRRPPRQQLLQLLHAPAICLSGGSRLPFARPQTPQTLPQASKATTLTATCPQTPQTLPTRPQASKATTLTATTCPCHLSFRGFKTAVCPPSNPRQQLLQLQLLLQDCRLLGLKPPKRFQPARRPPRQQLLQLLHAPAICLSGGSRLPFARPQTPQTLPQASKAPAICFSGGSRLPFARPQTPQTPQTLPQASKATTLTATCPQTPQTLPTLPQASKATTLTATTCPCHLFFRGFKTAVCPPSNPPYYFKTAVCSASNPRNASNPPAGLQGNNSYSYYMPLPSVLQGVQDCRLPALKSKATTLTATATTSRLPFARPQTPQTLPTRPQASKATTLTATTCPCHLSFRGFKTAVCPPSNPPNPPRRPPRHLPSVFQGVQDCRLPALKPPKPPKPSRRPPRQQLLQLHALKPTKRFQPSRRPPRQQLLQLLHAPAICFSGGSSLPFARPQTPQTLPQASKATTLTATCPQTPQMLPTLPQASKATTLTATTCPCHLFFRGFKTAVCPASNPPNASNPPAGLQGNNSYSYYHAPAICFSGGSRLPFAHPQTPQTLPQASKAPAICFSGGSSLPFGRPQTPQTLPQASKATTLTATCPQTPQTLPTLPQASKATTLTATTCPCHLFFRGFKTARLPALKPPLLLQDCRLPGLKPPKRFQPARRPPRQQLLQLLHAPAICFSGGSRLPFAHPQTPQTLPQASKAPAICFSGGSSLPFARRQTPQTLPQASKARTLTATCPQTPQTLPTLPTAAWALHVSRALRYHACAFEATDASAADCGLSRQSLATFGTNKA